MYFQNKDKYTGEWFNGAINGDGVLNYANGNLGERSCSHIIGNFA